MVLIRVDKGAGVDYKYFRNTRVLQDFGVQVSGLVSFTHLFRRGVQFLILVGVAH